MVLGLSTRRGIRVRGALGVKQQIVVAVTYFSGPRSPDGSGVEKQPRSNVLEHSGSSDSMKRRARD